MTEENKIGKNERFKHAACYAPFGAIVLFFVENNKTEPLKKHMLYGFTIFIVYAILNLAGIGILSGVFAVIYVGIIVYLGVQAYNGEEISINFIDSIGEKFKNKM